MERIRRVQKGLRIRGPEHQPISVPRTISNDDEQYRHDEGDDK